MRDLGPRPAFRQLIHLRRGGNLWIRSVLTAEDYASNLRPRQKLRLGSQLICLNPKTHDVLTAHEYFRDMRKYYLHVRRGGTIYEDRHGVEATVDEAVEHAKVLGREIMRDEPEVPAQLQWIEVADDVGNTVRTVPFVTL